MEVDFFFLADAANCATHQSKQRRGYCDEGRMLEAVFGKWGMVLVCVGRTEVRKLRLIQSPLIWNTSFAKWPEGIFLIAVGPFKPTLFSFR